MDTETEILNCTLCDGRFAKAIDDGKFSVLRCDSCGFGVTVPPPDDLAPFYENYYGGRHSFTMKYRAKRRVSRVKRFVQTGRILDIGYGEGTFLIEAGKAGFERAGVERYRNGGEAFGTFDDINEVSQKFDAITMWHSLEHLPDIDTTLVLTSVLLNDNGSLLIAVPNFGGRQARLFGRDWLHLDLPRHLYHFTSKSLENLLKRRGFRIDEVWHHESEYDIMGWSQSILNKITGTKNIFFNMLTGKETNAGLVSKTFHFILGSSLSVLAIPLVLIDIATRSGGTLVIKAVKFDNTTQISAK